MYSKYFQIFPIHEVWYFVVPGLSLQDILSEVHLYVHRLELPAQVKIILLIKLAELESRLMAGSSEKIQLGGFLAAFQVTREMIKAEAGPD